MRIEGARVAGAGWAGRWGHPPSFHDLTRKAPAPRPADPATLAALFPGRWNPHRALPDGLEPLVTACVMALEEAGWWREGDLEPVPGALVLGSDSLPLLAAAGFARDLAERGPAGLGPTGFLFSLPSSATTVLGILLGLREYQATVVEGGRSGLRAVAHAVDLLRAGRISRAAVAAVSAVRAGPGAALIPGGEEAARAGELDLAVALCLEPAGAADVAVDFDAGSICPAHRPLAAPTLLAAIRSLPPFDGCCILGGDP